MKRIGVLKTPVFLLLIYSATGIAAIRNVKDYGAVGDGITSDTAAINAAVAACEPGDTVYFPAGTFRSGSIVLKSHITLELSEQATLLATSGPEYSPVAENPWYRPIEYQDWGHSHWESSLIWGIGLENITITGTGLIDGEGLTAGDPAPLRGDRAISFKYCTGIVIEHIKIYRAGHFGIIATGCTDITINNVLIDTNRDGINIDCCSDVVITHCIVNAPKDDAICMKSSYALGYKRPTENVLIEHCTVMGYRVGDIINNVTPRAVDPSGWKHGRIKFGTESNGGFKNITIRNCYFEHSYGFMLATVDGGDIENITISDIEMVNLFHPPIFLRLGNRARGPGSPPPGTYRNLTMTNITATMAPGAFRISCIATGIPGHNIENVVFDNVTVHTNGGGAASDAHVVLGENEQGYPEATMFGLVTPSYAFYLRHVDGITFRNCGFTFAADDQRPSFVMVDAHNIAIEETQAARSPHNDKFVTFRDTVSNLTVYESPAFPMVTAASYGYAQTSKPKVFVGEPFTVSVPVTAAAGGIISTDMHVNSQLHSTAYLWVNSGQSDTVVFKDIQSNTPGRLQIQAGGSSFEQGVFLRSDFDMNFVTDIRDLALMANDWLEDSTEFILGSDPVAWWQFSEGSGTVAVDSSGHGNHGTIHGNPPWVPGKTGTAIEFGSGRYIRVPDSPSLRVGGGDFTLSAWVYPYSVTGKRGIVTKVKNTMDKEYAFSIENQALALEIEWNANDGREATGPAVVTNAWQHVMVVFDSQAKDARFYVNEQLQEIISDSITALPRYFNDDLYIGRWGGIYSDGYFSGIIDDVRIYNMPGSPKRPPLQTWTATTGSRWPILRSLSQSGCGTLKIRFCI